MPFERRLNRKRAVLLALAAIMLIALAIYAGRAPSADHMLAVVPPAQDPGYRFWQARNPNAKVVCWSQGDLNNDGQAETVVIYAFANSAADYESGSKEVNGRSYVGDERWMTVIVPVNNSFLLTEPQRAPASNQKIDFKDIDQKDPVELIISGTKASEAGYAVYRLNGTSLENLFGESMDKCCYSDTRTKDYYC